VTTRLCIGLLASAFCACLSGPTPAQTSDGPINDGAVTDALVSDAIAADALVNDAVASANTHAYNFPGSGRNYFFVSANGANTVDLNGTVTFETWFKLGAIPAVGERFALFIKSDDAASSSKNYGFAIKNISGELWIVSEMDGTLPVGGNASDKAGVSWPGLGIGDWHHVAVTYDIAKLTVAERFSFYRDGTLVPTTIKLSAQEPIALIRKSVTTDVTIGARVSGDVQTNQLNGILDEIRLWSIVRSPSAILSSRDTELNGGNAGLLGYWQLDSDTGFTSTHDHSGNDNDLGILGEVDSGFESVDEHAPF